MGRLIYIYAEERQGPADTWRVQICERVFHTHVCYPLTARLTISIAGLLRSWVAGTRWSRLILEQDGQPCQGCIRSAPVFPGAVMGNPQVAQAIRFCRRAA